MYKQIIPVKGVYAQFKTEDKCIDEQKVIALALDEKGKVCPLIVDAVRGIISAEDCSDFIELCDHSHSMNPETVQIVAASNLRAAFKDKGGKVFHLRVDVLALKDDGAIVPLHMDASGYCYEDVTETDGFIRIERE